MGGRVDDAKRRVRGDLVLEASPRAVRAAAALGAGIRAGSAADLAVFVDELQRAGLKVQVPASLLDPSLSGWIVTRRKKCGRPECRCARPGELGHGPYASRRWRDEWGRRREEYLGVVRAPGEAPRHRFGPLARGGKDSPRPSPAQVGAAPARPPALDPRVLHDD